MRYPGTVALLAGAVLAAGLPGCNQLAGHMANRRGKALYQRGEIAAAADEFRRATLDDPADPDYRHNLAAATDKLTGAGRSEMLYRQALTLNPDHQPTVHKLAELYLNTGRPDAARELTAN
ncbi:MAG: tetratricopeptide repeat protein, partial [Planctomycetota bacterium]